MVAAVYVSTNGAILGLFIFLLFVAAWGELGPNGTWSKIQRASEQLDRDQRGRR